MQPDNKKGYQQLLSRRIFCSIFSSIIVHFFLVFLLIFVGNFHTNVIVWLSSTWVSIASFQLWCYFMILTLLHIALGLIYSKNYFSTSIYLKNRFFMIRNLFTSKNLLLSCIHIVFGVISVWLQLSLYEYNEPSKCTSLMKFCLKDNDYVLLLGGIWNGIYYAINSNYLMSKQLKFPIIPQTKFSRLKLSLQNILPTLMVNALWSTMYFTVTYYFMGPYLNTTGTSVVSPEQEKSLNSIWGLLNFSLIFHLWLYQLVYLLTMNSMHLLFEIHLTEWIPFKFEQVTVFNNDNLGLTLTEALSMDSIPILQYLSYMDFITIAQKDKVRRSMLYTLSQPGGHPYNWNSVIEKCLSLINTFATDLNAALIRKEQSVSPLIIPAAVANNQTEYKYRMRSLVGAEIQNNTIGIVEQKSNTADTGFLIKYIRTKWQNLMIHLLSKPVIHYIFGEQEDNKIKHVLHKSQLVIWAAESISSIAILSLVEDCYGIVQKDVTRMINTLLLLKQALDKLQKSNLLIRKPRNEDKLIKQTIATLKSASKRSLYKITTYYEKYMVDLALDSATMDQLQSFLHYKE